MPGLKEVLEIILEEYHIHNQVPDALYPSAIPIDRSFSERKIERKISRDFLYRKKESLIDLTLYHYPVWKNDIGIRKSRFWKIETILCEVYIEGFDGKYIQATDHSLSFRDTFDSRAGRCDVFTGIDFSLSPALDFPVIGSGKSSDILEYETAGKLALKAVEDAALYKTTMIFMPVWIGVTQSLSDERQKIYAIDAMKGRLLNGLELSFFHLTD